MHCCWLTVCISTVTCIAVGISIVTCITVGVNTFTSSTLRMQCTSSAVTCTIGAAATDVSSTVVPLLVFKCC